MQKTIDTRRSLQMGHPVYVRQLLVALIAGLTSVSGCSNSNPEQLEQEQKTLVREKKREAFKLIKVGMDVEEVMRILPSKLIKDDSSRYPELDSYTWIVEEKIPGHSVKRRVWIYVAPQSRTVEKISPEAWPPKWDLDFTDDED